METIIIVVLLILAFIIIRKVISKNSEDFAQKFSRIFTHVYRSNEEGFSLALSASFDRGRTFSEKSIEAMFGNQFESEDINEIIDNSIQGEEVALDLLIINTFAKSIFLSRGGSLETTTKIFFRDKHDEVIKGIEVADAEIKRGYAPKEAKEILEQASTQRVSKLISRELGSALNQSHQKSQQKPHRKSQQKPSQKEVYASSYTIEGGYGEFGYEETNPIPAKGQQGSVDYLSRLQCKCEDGFYFHRLGSAGQCPDGHTVDVYELLCMSGCTRGNVFVDMYHPKPTSLVPNGLTAQDHPIGVGMPHCIQDFPGFLVNQRPDKKPDDAEKSDKNDGQKVSQLILKFLNSSSGYKYSEFTFTELFSFAYFEIDSVLSARKIPNREVISKSLSIAYSDTIESEFKVKNGEHHTTIMNSRIREYAEDLNAKTEKAEMIDSLSFYLDQASIKNGYLLPDEPVTLGEDFMSSMKGKHELAQFYMETLAPFIKKLI